MKFITEYRDKNKVEALAREIAAVAAGHPMTLMEVCGTHTMAIARFGIHALLPKSIRLISGPGCPVCVTPIDYIDHAIAISNLPKTIICTFGDMVRVPGSFSSLEKERAAGADVQIVYSTLDAVEVAQKNPQREVVFLGIGFETTAPTVAAAIIEAKQSGLKNFSVLCACKVVPPALCALLEGPVKLDGFILPGHVSAIIGAEAYRPILEKYKIAGAIAGFEPTDILESMLSLVKQVAHKKMEFSIPYSRAVEGTGNAKALACLNEVFENSDAKWRGIGNITGSGLKIRSAFGEFDAAKRFSVTVRTAGEPQGCRCGEVLTGAASPPECHHFGNNCTPANPVGACMVSGEGTCAAYYKYRNTTKEIYT